MNIDSGPVRCIHIVLVHILFPMLKLKNRRGIVTNADVVMLNDMQNSIDLLLGLNLFEHNHIHASRGSHSA